MSPVPLLSILVIGYRMARQLEQTLYTLSICHQQGVSESEYEIIVIENESNEMLDETVIGGFGKNIRYYSRKEVGRSPVPAVNFGFSQCRGEVIGLMIDGAHMVTPRVVQYVLMASKAVAHPLIVIPGYHLGGQIQSSENNQDYNEVVEKEMMAKLDWKNNGYRLFEIAAFSPANRHSYMHPIMECNCVFASRLSFERIGYCDERFTLGGGGSINLHLYRQLGILPEVELIVLPGEGSFHQYHGGVSTSLYHDRKEEIDAHRQQLNGIWGGRYQSLRKEPILFGAVTYWAQSFLKMSSENAKKRYERLEKLSRPEWEDSDSPEPVIPSLSIAEAKEQLVKKRINY